LRISAWALNGISSGSSQFPEPGRHLLVFNKQLQAGAKAKPGNMVAVVMERDTEEWTIEPPAELAKAFRQSKEAKTLWDKLAYTHRKEFAQWIGGGKQAETRERRAAKAVSMVLAKKTISDRAAKGTKCVCC
jgi:uncharacterized protein YdeI (YjbR/CyaY-like superfamily)